MARHRVLRTQLDQSLRALIGAEHVDAIIDDADPDYVVVFTEDRIETRPTGEVPVTLTHAARLGIEARGQAS